MSGTVVNELMTKIVATDFKSISCAKVGYIERINKVLLSSTGNYIQYPETNHNGKKNMKGDIYIVYI